MPKKRDYEVGKGKPPKDRQFRPGESGNRKGRPLGSKNLGAEIARELKRKVPITENGRQRRVSKRSVVAKQLVNKAATGDLKAVQTVLKATPDYDGEPNQKSMDDIFDTEDHHLTIANIVRRIRDMAAELPEQTSGDVSSTPNNGESQ